MDIEFRNKVLENLESDSAVDFAHEARLPIPVVKSAQKKLQFMKAAPDENTLWNWRSLRYEKLGGDKEGLSSIRLNDQWRLVFQLVSTEDGLKAVIFSIEDYH